MRIKESGKALWNSDWLTYVLTGLVLVTVILGGIKILFIK